MLQYLQSTHADLLLIKRKTPDNQTTNRGHLYPGRDLNPHDRNGHWILSPTCLPFHHLGIILSGKRDSDSRPRPWQGRALPTELFPHKMHHKRTIFTI